MVTSSNALDCASRAADDGLSAKGVFDFLAEMACMVSAMTGKAIFPSKASFDIAAAITKQLWTAVASFLVMRDSDGNTIPARKFMAHSSSAARQSPVVWRMRRVLPGVSSLTIILVLPFQSLLFSSMQQMPQIVCALCCQAINGTKSPGEHLDYFKRRSSCEPSRMPTRDLLLQ